MPQVGQPLDIFEPALDDEVVALTQPFGMGRRDDPLSAARDAQDGETQRTAKITLRNRLAGERRVVGDAGLEHPLAQAIQIHQMFMPGRFVHRDVGQPPPADQRDEGHAGQHERAPQREELEEAKWPEAVLGQNFAGD